jgi:very-short-patch-repair endonuclease
MPVRLSTEAARRWQSAKAPSVRQVCAAIARSSPSSEERIDYPALLAFQCGAAKLPAPVREHRFHAERKYLFDLAWPAELLAVEIDGGIWRKDRGAHGRPRQILRDMEKLNHATELGWRLLRFSTDQVSQGIALKWIERCLRAGAPLKA